MRRRRANIRFAFTAIVLVALVAVFAFTLKNKGKSGEDVPGSQTEQVVDPPQVAEATPNQTKPPEATPAESEPGTVAQAVSEEEIEAQRASFVTDYESAPLLNTTPIKYLTVEMGGKPGEVAFNWFSPSGAAGKVMLYDVNSGESQTITAQTAASATEAGFFYSKARAEGLKENTTYAYKVGNDAGWSPEYQFSTTNFTGDFTFLAVSDAQIGQSQFEEMEATAERWDKVANRLTKYVPEAAFLAHLGDQVAGYNDPTNYEGFFSHLGLYRIPLVPVVGNHDVDNWDSGGGPWFYERYNVPNRSTIGCNWADTDGDYWFRYGNTLFMVLNSDTLYGVTAHEDFIRQTCDANPDAKWRIIMQHYPSYSSVEKYQGISEKIRGACAEWSVKYNIDLYLNGHDHAYTRSAVINGQCETISDYDYESGATAVNPQGAIYVTCGTASGCLYQPVAENYAAVKQGQPEVPTAIRVDVGENTIKLTTYLVDSWQVYDEYTIQKD